MGTDRDWEKWGASDPYFGVCSSGRFHTHSMAAEARADFFSSGEAHVSRTWDEIEHAFAMRFRADSVLDFGCGVGRLLIPFARRAKRVVGVDISLSMLKEADKNCRAAGAVGVEFVESDDGLRRVDGTFDLVHSHIVLQHIPWRRGRAILAMLAGRVAPGGFLAVQILSRHEASPIVRGLVRLRYVLPPVNWLRNILRRRPVFEPAMQLHVYDFETVRTDLEQQGFSSVHLHERFDGFRSTSIYARRSA